MLSVIICTYNREKYIGNLLESIVRNSLSKEKYEIILIDNNCTDGTKDICSEFAFLHPDVNFRYILETEQGLSAAKNCGIRNAKGDLVVFVDDDALVDEDYLITYADFMETHEDVMAAGGPIIPLYETEEPAWMSPYTKALLTAWMDYGDKVREYPKGKYPGGGNAAYRKVVFDKVGLFNTELGRKGGNLMGAEEKDIFAKMRDMNMKIMYLPSLVLHHIIPQKKLESTYFNQLTSQIGISERKRTLAISKGKYMKRLFAELVKWGGTMVLLCGYCIQGRTAAGWKLVQFRSNVTKGLLGK